ncbi:MAG: aldehyde dehydrogenase family protein [Gammaproteobacteria bacterium]|nr:MAG: aldehyde dehydrogenase family protein [Gammaproteobacteria bacterium]
MIEHNKIYIDGQWVESSGDGISHLVNPATEEVFAKVPMALPEDVDKAVRAARRAFIPWSQTPAVERKAYIDAICEKLTERKDELASLISQEMGIPVHFSMGIQVMGPISGLQIFANLAESMDEVTEHDGGYITVKEAVGVCSFITPWNFPLFQVIAKVGPALAAGCTCVLKPSEQTPLCTFIFAEVCEQVGLPAGVFNLVTGKGSVIGDTLSSHPEIDLVSFTGSTEVGIDIAKSAATSVKRVCQELGGKSPFIIAEDAPVAKAVKYVIKDSMFNSGQMCVQLSRILVHESQYEEALEVAKTVADSLVVGDPTDKGTFLGPLSSMQARDSVVRYIEKGLAEGARLVTGGPELPEGIDKGAFVKPTILGDVNNDMAVAREEIFGPVLCFIPYKDEAEAIAIANDTDFGLSSGLWAEDKDTQMRIAKQLRAGQVKVNGPAFSFAAPFGGYKMSGNGREWGASGLVEYTEEKAILTGR